MAAFWADWNRSLLPLESNVQFYATSQHKGERLETMVSLDKTNDKEGGFFGNIPSSPHPQSKLFVFEEDWTQKVNT